ncbi:MAG: helix-turn-helix domain-containing protein, partial [Candidatus Sumerlaeota bacterium]
MPQSQMIQSLLRGLDVLALLAECSDGMALKDVAGALDVKPPTAHNLLRTLCARGFARNDGGRYRVGPALQELAGKSRKGGLREKAEATMRQVAEAFPEGRITFDEFSGGELRAVLRMSPDLPRM